MTKGYAALGVMEQHLAHSPFFVGDRYGLADIALYAYTHVADEGGFDLDNFPQVTPGRRASPRNPATSRSTTRTRRGREPCR